MKHSFLFLAAMLFDFSAAAAQVFDVPYSQTFDNSSSMDDFIILDANNDDETWHYNQFMHQATCSASYNSDSDDYILLPLHLMANAQYEVAFGCYAAKFSTGRFVVYLADAPSVAGMKTQLTEPKEVRIENENDLQRVSFSVPTEGTYYLALHNCSEAGVPMYLKSVEVTSTGASAPAAPTLLSAVPGEQGARTCDLTFSLPTQTLEGGELSAISQVNIYRNDELAASITKDAEGQALLPGASCTWHDEAPGNRLYTYKIAAVNAKDGKEGAPAVVEVYVGIDRPGRVDNLQLREDPDRMGHIIMTWEAPTVGVHGGYLDPKGLSYVVSLPNSDELTVYEPRFETDLTVGDTQTYAAFSVYAQNFVGSNHSNWQTISTHLGPAVVAPWAESFESVSSNGGPWLTHVTNDTEIGDASWYVSSPVYDVPAQDGDGGYTYFFTNTQNRSSRYTSPKIDIRELSSPTLSFWLYDKGLGDVVEVGVMPEMTEWATLQTITFDSGKGWRRFEIDLSQFTSARYIQVGFNGICKGNEPKFVTAVDNLSIRNSAARDLTVEKYEFPVRVNVGTSSAFTLTLRNRGSEALDAGSYTIELYRQDGAEAERTKVSSVAGKALASDKTTTVTLKDNPEIFTPKQVFYSAEVMLDGDASPSDNIVAPQPVTVFMPPYPTPDELAANCNGEGVDISWKAPESGEGTALRVTDDFESYPIFSIDECGDWTLYDGDKQFTLTMALNIAGDIQLLEYEHAGEPMAWQVFSPLDAGIPYGSWEPHSGDLMMVAMGNAQNKNDGRYHDNDDWLISPELSGRAQQVSFFAKCGMSSAYQPERLEVLYSTTDSAPESFISLGDVTELYNVNGWEEFIVEIPAGARHFALRCVSEHKFALLLDDVTYQPAGSSDLTIKGYNIYRNRIRLNEDPLPTPYFVDTTAEDGMTYEYCVTAVYDKGESLPSAPISITYTLNSIDLQLSPEASFERYDLQGRRIKANSPTPIIINKTTQKTIHL